jgi:hypothetical protein
MTTRLVFGSIQPPFTARTRFWPGMLLLFLAVLLVVRGNSLRTALHCLQGGIRSCQEQCTPIWRPRQILCAEPAMTNFDLTNWPKPGTISVRSGFDLRVVRCCAPAGTPDRRIPRGRSHCRKTSFRPTDADSDLVRSRGEAETNRRGGNQNPTVPRDAEPIPALPPQKGGSGEYEAVDTAACPRRGARSVQDQLPGDACRAVSSTLSSRCILPKSSLASQSKTRKSDNQLESQTETGQRGDRRAPPVCRAGKAGRSFSPTA